MTTTTNVLTCRALFTDENRWNPALSEFEDFLRNSLFSPDDDDIKTRILSAPVKTTPDSLQKSWLQARILLRKLAGTEANPERKIVRSEEGRPCVCVENETDSSIFSLPSVSVSHSRGAVLAAGIECMQKSGLVVVWM